MLIQVAMVAFLAFFYWFVLPRMFPTVAGRKPVVMKVKRSGEENQPDEEAVILTGGMSIMGGDKRSHARATQRKTDRVAQNSI